MALPPIKRPMAPLPGGINPGAPRPMPTAPRTRPSGAAPGAAPGAGLGNRMGGALTNGALKGYTGPMPGTPEFKAARAAGETPIRDYLKANRPTPAARPTMALPNRPLPGPMGPRPGPMGGGNPGPLPPGMGSPVPRPGFAPTNPTAPRPMMAEGGVVKKKGSTGKVLSCTGHKTKAGH